MSQPIPLPIIPQNTARDYKPARLTHHVADYLRHLSRYADSDTLIHAIRMLAGPLQSEVDLQRDDIQNLRRIASWLAEEISKVGSLETISADSPDSRELPGNAPPEQLDQLADDVERLGNVVTTLAVATIRHQAARKRHTFVEDHPETGRALRAAEDAADDLHDELRGRQHLGQTALRAAGDYLALATWTAGAWPPPTAAS